MPALTEEQERIINTIDKHMLVSAGAGSGKTFVLVERYLKILESDPQAKVSDIIAVTYTRKAAEEMRSRLKARLSRIAADLDPKEAERWQMHLSELESARIGTIHSLCESILRSYPADAGIDPSFEILDDLERASILQESIDLALSQLLEEEAGESSDLLEFPVEEVRTWISAFLASPLKYKEARNRLYPDSDEDSLAAFAERLIQEDCRLAVSELVSEKQFQFELKYLTDSSWSDPESKLGVLLQEMQAYLAVLSKTPRPPLPELYEAIYSISLMAPARTAGGPAGKELRQSIKYIRDAAKDLTAAHKFKSNESDQRAFKMIKTLLKLSELALKHYESKKGEAQRLDFDDLIEKCSLLLCPAAGKNTNSFDQSAYMKKELSKKLKAVLVDEYQDTNWTQARLLSSLCSESSSLFLIGDDKQSIYKFQGADVSVFNASKAYIESMGKENSELTAKEYGLPPLQGEAELLSLSKSFRSHPQIVRLVNHLFSRLLKKLEIKQEQSEALLPDFKAGFQPLLPARSEEGDSESCRVEIVYTALLDKEKTEDLRLEYQKLETDNLCRWINSKVESGSPVFDKELGRQRPIRYSDFAVLLQANSDFADIERALSKAEIPSVSIAGSGFLDRQEIIDLENLLAWLDSPQDSHSLFAVLRSPMFAVSDDLIHLMRDKSSSLFQNLLKQATQTKEPCLLRAAEILSQLKLSRANCNTSEILGKIIELTAYDLVLLAAPQGKQRSRNLYKFLSLADQHKHMRLAEFLSALESMRQLKVKNLTDAPLNAGNAVRIMTIHKSKGLEFAAVALLKLDRPLHLHPGRLLFSKETGIALDCTREPDEEKPAFFQAANNINKRMEAEEKKRLLYVAMTRPRDYLGIFFTPRISRDKNFGKWLLETLELPAPEALIETQVMTQGSGESSCKWQLSQTAENAPQPKALLPEQTKARFQVPDLEICSPIASQEKLKYTTVKWQSLLRVSQHDNESKQSGLHQTIAGNYFHLLMSKLGPSLELPGLQLREALLLHPELSIYDREQQREALALSEHLLLKFKNSKLYTLMKNSRRRLHESAYMIVDAEGKHDYRPDLILEDSDGNWQIVDYKTDRLQKLEIEKQIQTHSPQLLRYVQDLETLIGQKASAWIYFAQAGRLEKVEPANAVQLSLFGSCS